MAQSNVKLTVDGSQATRALGQVQNKTRALTGAVNTLRNAFLGIGATAVVSQVVKQATSFEKLNVRLKLLTKSQGTYAESLELVEQAQKKFGLSSAEALEGVTNLQARLGPLGTSMDEITAIFNGFNTAAILSGASAQEQAGAMRQLTQALGSGVLRGEEFNSISEQMSAVQKPIADQLGINVGQLRAYAAQGKITADVVVKAFKEIEKEGGKMLEELIKQDPTMAFKLLDNQIKELSISVGKLFTPTVLKVTEHLTTLTQELTKLASGEGSALGKTILIFTGVALAAKAVMTASAILTTQIIALKTSFVTMQIAAAAASGQLGVTTTMAFAAAGGFAKATAAANAFKIALAKTGIGLAVIALGFMTAEIIKASDEQKRFNQILEEGSAATVTEEIEKVTDTIDKLEKKIAKIKAEEEGDGGLWVSGAIHLEEKLVKANKQLDGLNERLVIAQGIELWKEFDKTKKAIHAQNAELETSIERAKLGTEEEKKAFDLKNKSVELIEKYGEKLAEPLIAILKENQAHEATIETIKKKKEAAQALKEQYKAIGDTIRSDITGSIKEAIQGSKSLGDAMGQILNKIADQAMEVALNMALWGSVGTGGSGGLLGGLFSGLGFANGGRPPVGKASVVGERGPELFIPSTSGTIIPNNQLGGGSNVTVNVDAKGNSQVEGNEEKAKQLGSAISAAVQAELVKQKMPGGLLFS